MQKTSFGIEEIFPETCKKKRTQARQHTKWAKTKTTAWKILQRGRRNSRQKENVNDLAQKFKFIC